MLALKLILLIPFVLAGLLLLPVTLKVDYRQQGRDRLFEFDMYIPLNFLWLKVRVGLLRNILVDYFADIIREIRGIFQKIIYFSATDGNQQLKTTDMGLRRLNRLIYLLGKRDIIVSLELNCHKFKWITSYSTGDAAVTAVSYGLFWNLKGIFLKHLDRYVSYSRNDLEIEIIPDFNNTEDYLFSTQINGIFSTRLGNIITVVIRILIYQHREGVADAGGYHRQAD